MPQNFCSCIKLGYKEKGYPSIGMTLGCRVIQREKELIFVKSRKFQSHNNLPYLDKKQPGDPERSHTPEWMPMLPSFCPTITTSKEASGKEKITGLLSHH